MKNFRIWSFFSILFAAVVVVAFAASFYINFYNTKDVLLFKLEENRNISVNLFVSNIEKDLKFGLHPEVYQKCTSLREQDGILGLRVVGADNKSICDMKAEDLKSFSLLTKNIYFGDEKKNLAGFVEIFFSKDAEKVILDQIYNSQLIGYAIIFIALMLALILISERLSRPLRRLSEALNSKNLLEIQKFSETSNSYIREYNELYAKIGSMAERAQAFYREREQRKRSEHVYNAVKNVLHDFREPILTLRLKVKNLGLPFEDQKEIDCDLEMMANLTQDILQKHNVSSRSEMKSIQSTDLIALIDEVAKNSRLTAKNQKDVSIDIVNRPSKESIFIDARALTLRRIFTNIIKNSVESIEKIGSVSISIKLEGNNAVVLIKDSGKGISKENLTKITERGFTHGKTNGNGYGLSYCLEEIAKHGGELQFESELGKGTMVRIALPIAKTPIWSIQSFEVSEKSKVIILDDDPNIHDYWRDKASKSTFEKFEVEMIHLDSVDVFVKFMETAPSNLKDYYFFMDYDLKGSKTGAELLIEYSLFSQAIIVSNHYDDTALLQICTQNAIKLFPKQKLADAQFTIKKSSGHLEAKNRVIILDDHYEKIRGIESFLAKEGIIAEGYSTYDELLASAAKITPSTPILVDMNLADSRDGLYITRDLFSKGLKSLYLFSGETVENIQDKYWLKGQICKSSPKNILKIFKKDLKRSFGHLDDTESLPVS